MNTRLSPATATLLALLIAIPVTVAASDEFRIAPYPWNDGKEYTVTTDQTVYVGWGWAAASPGLVRSFLTSIRQALEIQSLTDPNWRIEIDAATAAQLWGPVLPWDDPGNVCVRGHVPTSLSIWRYDLPQLQPGDYLVHFSTSTSHAGSDGCPDVPPSPVPYIYHAGPGWDTTITLHVVPPD